MGLPNKYWKHTTINQNYEVGGARDGEVFSEYCKPTILPTFFSSTHSHLLSAVIIIMYTEQNLIRLPYAISYMCTRKIFPLVKPTVAVVK